MLFLQRLHSSINSTTGVFINASGIICYSLELPWRDNARNISCIPVGEYRCHKSYSSKHGHVVRLVDVPNRSDILIHAGNQPSDTQGCILPGLDISYGVVLNSKVALRRLLLHVPTSFTITVS